MLKKNYSDWGLLVTHASLVRHPARILHAFICTIFPIQSHLGKGYFASMSLNQFRDKDSFANNKRNLLGTRIALLSVVFASVHALIDLYHGYEKSFVFDCIIVSVLFACYVLSKLQFHLIAKIIGLLSMNLAFAVYTSVAPKEVGLFMYYFPLMAASTALFGANEKSLRYFFILLPFVLLLLLLIVDFNLIGNAELYNNSSSNFFFTINVISSGIIMITCIDFMRRLNEASENKLQLLAREIKAKNDDLEKANKELDSFLYSTSHDLRSPLASIKGLANVARFDTADKKIHSYFDMIIDRVNRLEHFIKDIIDYSKNARTEVENEPLDIKSLIDEVIDNLKYLEGAEKIQFRNKVDLDHLVAADKSRLNVVLTNLTANAIKYHDHRKADRWIAIKAANSGGTLKFAVSDNGTGISDEHQHKIFDMFYRGTLQSNGSGLGLYIVKQAIEKMQGSIKVESQAGEGTTFHVTVPVA